MPECARCNDFTDNPRTGKYYYFESCLTEFDDIKRKGVVVEQDPKEGNYDVNVAVSEQRHKGGTELSQVDALARGKHLVEELSLSALFIYHNSGSQWVLDEYLDAHPAIRRDVNDRLRRVPEKVDGGLISKIKEILT